MKHLIIIGARGYGRVVYNLAVDCIANGSDFDIKGFLDSKTDALDCYENYPPIISSVEDYQIQTDDVFVCALGEVKYKKLYAEKILSKGGEFISIISPHAIVMTNVEFGCGCIVGDGANIGCDTKIGNFTTILGLASIGHDVEIGDWCHIGGFCFMGGFSKLNEGATIQTGSKILPKKIIGEYASVGAGSVVIRNVKDGTSVFGVPAKLVDE